MCVSISMHIYLCVHQGGREKSNSRKTEFATELEPRRFSFQPWEGRKAVHMDPLVTSCHIIPTSESSPPTWEGFPHLECSSTKLLHIYCPELRSRSNAT